VAILAAVPVAGWLLEDSAERKAESRKLAFTDTEVATETIHRSVKKCRHVFLSAAREHFVRVFALRSRRIIVAVDVSCCLEVTRETAFFQQHSAMRMRALRGTQLTRTEAVGALREGDGVFAPCKCDCRCDSIDHARLSELSQCRFIVLELHPTVL
jgi:hypothetical protein